MNYDDGLACASRYRLSIFDFVYSLLCVVTDTTYYTIRFINQLEIQLNYNFKLFFRRHASCEIFNFIFVLRID